MSILWRNILIGGAVASVIALTWSLAIHGDIKSEDWIQALATIVTGALIPFVYYYVIAKPESTQTALHTTVAEEIKDIMVHIRETYHMLQGQVAAPDPVILESAGARISFSHMRLFSLHILVESTKSMGALKIRYIEHAVSFHSQFGKNILNLDSSDFDTRLDVMVRLNEALIGLNYNYVALLLSLNGSNAMPLTPEEFATMMQRLDDEEKQSGGTIGS